VPSVIARYSRPGELLPQIDAALNKGNHQTLPRSRTSSGQVRRQGQQTDEHQIAPQTTLEALDPPLTRQHPLLCALRGLWLVLGMLLLRCCTRRRGCAVLYNIEQNSLWLVCLSPP
jgi:hypothetical protein